MMYREIIISHWTASIAFLTREPWKLIFRPYQNRPGMEQPARLWPHPREGGSPMLGETASRVSGVHHA